MYTGTKILNLDKFKGKIYTHIDIRGKERKAVSDALMMAAGIKAHTQFNLEAAGV